MPPKKKREKSLSGLSDKQTKKLLKKILNEVEKKDGKKKKSIKGSRNSSWDKKTQRSSSVKIPVKKRTVSSIFDSRTAREILEPNR